MIYNTDLILSRAELSILTAAVVCNQLRELGVFNKLHPLQNLGKPALLNPSPPFFDLGIPVLLFSSIPFPNMENPVLLYPGNPLLLSCFLTCPFLLPYPATLSCCSGCRTVLLLWTAGLSC
jgi:hypothetical protein